MLRQPFNPFISPSSIIAAHIFMFMAYISFPSFLLQSVLMCDHFLQQSSSFALQPTYH
jgi:hypothetical protein